MQLVSEAGRTVRGRKRSAARAGGSRRSVDVGVVSMLRIAHCSGSGAPPAGMRSINVQSRDGVLEQGVSGATEVVELHPSVLVVRRDFMIGGHVLDILLAGDGPVCGAAPVHFAPAQQRSLSLSGQAGLGAGESFRSLACL